MARARLTINTGNLRRTFTNVGRRAAERGATLVMNRAKVLAPVDTGRLRASIRVQRGVSLRGITYTIGSDVEYAQAVHDGSGPYVIRPVRAQALRFVIGGRVVFAKVVHHPGTRGRPFLARALQEVARSEGWRYRN